MKKILIYLPCLLFLGLIFINYNIVLDSTINACYIWLYKVFPYLFIMIILNNILINLNFYQLFKKPSTYIFVMSMLSGSPTSAVIIGNLYKNNVIDKDYAHNSLLFAYFANPLFLYTMLNSIFKSNYLTLKLMVIHYLSNLIIYFMHKKKLNNYCKENNNNSTFNLTKAIKEAMNTNLMVLGTIIFYLVISSIILNTINMPPFISLLFRGILEMTQGLNFLIDASILSKEILAIFFLSFGGLSIHTQVKCLLDEVNLDYKYFLKGRIYQTLIALFLTFIT